jgi:hypothetical protein
MAAALCTACGDKKADDLLQYELSASIDVLDVVKDLKDTGQGALFPNGTIDDGSHVRVKFLIYNKEDGSLLNEETQIVDDFSKIVKVTKSVKAGEYIVVATADMVENTDDEIDFACWEFKNTSLLRDFQIKDKGYIGYEYKAMGVYKTSVTVDKAVSLNIKVKPVGGLVTFYFRNLTISTIAYLAYAWDKISDYYLVEDEKSYSANSPSGNEYEVKEQYNAVYDYRYFLPMQSLLLVWETYDAKEKALNSGSVTFDVTQGVNPLLTTDVKAGTTQLTTRAAFEEVTTRPQLPSKRLQSTAPSQFIQVFNYE